VDWVGTPLIVMLEEDATALQCPASVQLLKEPSKKTVNVPGQQIHANAGVISGHLTGRISLCIEFSRVQMQNFSSQRPMEASNWRTLGAHSERKEVFLRGACHPQGRCAWQEFQ
jgi:hypothetical protein